MATSLFDAFGVTSPAGDTKKIPLDKVCPMGTTDSGQKDFVFEYRPLRRILKNISVCQPIWAWGPSGCGKTELFIQIGARLRRPVQVVSFGEETSIRELMGTFELKSTDAGGMKTAFQYGHLTSSMKKEGTIVVLDEFNMAPAGVAASLNRLLEAGELTIPETGETVHAAKNVTFVVTANTPGGMDESGMYAGSQSQNGATRSRFSGLKLDYLPEEEEVKILEKACPQLNAVVKLPDTSALVTTLLVRTGAAIRSLVKEGEVSLPFTVRNLKLWGESTILLHDLADGFRDAYFDMLTATEEVAVEAVFHKVFGVHLT